MSRYKVGEKFVVEIDKIFEQGGEKLYRAKGMKSLVFDENGLRKLTPLEVQIKRQAAEITRLLRENKELSEMLTNAWADYDRACIDRYDEHMEGKTEGQKEAWELLKTMGNMYCSDFEKIFKTEEPWCVVHERTYAEAAEKVAAWEKAKNDEIHAGDVVKTDAGNLAVVGKLNGERVFLMFSDGSSGEHHIATMEKTGRTLSVQDWLAQIGGGESKGNEPSEKTCSNKNRGYYAGGEYEYSDIKSYEECCSCEHFSDNWHEERFECFGEPGEDCFEPKNK